MGYVFMIVMGATFGWLTSLMRSALTWRKLAINLAIGIFGALIAGLLIGPEIVAGNLARGNYSVDAVLVSMIGSLVLLVPANLLHGKELR